MLSQVLARMLRYALPCFFAESDDDDDDAPEPAPKKPKTNAQLTGTVSTLPV